MKLQVAIDRVDLDTAIKLARRLDSFVDIIEFGTSLVKDYGYYALEKEKLGLSHADILLDTKTIDEGEYEFIKGFETGADILTVMGASSIDTLNTTYEVTNKFGRQMFIDLMELSDDKIGKITKYENAIYGIHHSKDSLESFNAVESVNLFHKKFPQVKKLSIAGGINLEQAKMLKEQGIVETIIVGGTIINSTNPIKTAEEFMKVIK